MNPIVKNISISLVIALIAFLIIGFLHPKGPSVPSNMSEILSLIVIFIAVLSGTFFTSNSPDHHSYDDSAAETGTVKWFNIKKGYGFITRDAGDDIFVHYRNLQGKGRRAISEGQRVQFVVIDGDKGLQADDVGSI